MDTDAFRRGVDLFHGGRWWDAHAAWLGPWRASARGSTTYDALKGLIQVAAGCLKADERVDIGAEKLFRSAIVLLDRAARDLSLPFDVARLSADVNARLLAGTRAPNTFRIALRDPARRPELAAGSAEQPTLAL